MTKWFVDDKKNCLFNDFDFGSILAKSERFVENLLSKTTRDIRDHDLALIMVDYFDLFIRFQRHRWIQTRKPNFIHHSNTFKYVQKRGKTWNLHRRFLRSKTHVYCSFSLQKILKYAEDSQDIVCKISIT